jgi:hypothetical protein
MALILSISSPELDEERIQDLAFDLCKTLGQEIDVEAKLAERPGQIGDKGDPITLAAIVLTFLTSGAAVGMFNVFKSYFERKSSLEIELQRKDGKKLRIQAQNVSSGQIDRTMQQAEEFFRGAL